MFYIVQIRRFIVFGWARTFVPGRGRYVTRFKEDSDVSISSAEPFLSALYSGMKGPRLIAMMKMADIRGNE